jgi:hypothetical protein
VNLERGGRRFEGINATSLVFGDVNVEVDLEAENRGERLAPVGETVWDSTTGEPGALRIVDVHVGDRGFLFEPGFDC